MRFADICFAQEADAIAMLLCFAQPGGYNESFGSLGTKLMAYPKPGRSGKACRRTGSSPSAVAPGVNWIV